MTYQSYSKGIRLIFTVLGLLFILQQVGEALFEEQRLILAFLYLSIRIATLYLLFFSIYALLSKIKNLRFLESPLIFIMIAAIFIAATYGPPIAFYVMSRNTGSAFTKAGLNAAEVKRKALDSNVYVVERLQLVRNYYLDTGTRLSYLDEKNKETLFTPDEMAVKLYDATTKLKVSRDNLKITALSLIAIMALSVILFSIFLWYRFPQQNQNQV